MNTSLHIDHSEASTGEGGDFEPAVCWGRWCVSGWSTRRRGVVGQRCGPRSCCAEAFSKRTRTVHVGLSASPSLGSQLSPSPLPYRHGIRRNKSHDLTAHRVFALMIAVARATGTCTLVRARQRALVRPEAPNSPEFTSNVDPALPNFFLDCSPAEFAGSEHRKGPTTSAGLTA
jgi:hypothetical protein